MNLTLRIPDEIATRLAATGTALERQALEALVVESFRAGRLNKDELAQALGLEGGDQIDGFLKAQTCSSLARSNRSTVTSRRSRSLVTESACQRSSRTRARCVIRF